MRSMSTTLASTLTVGLGIGAGFATVGAVALSLTSGSAAIAQPADNQAQFATCDVVAIVEDIFAGEENAAAREELGARLQGELQTLQTQIQRLETELRLMPQNDPNRQLKLNQYSELNQQLEARANDSASQFQRFNAGLIADAFERVAEKARELSAEQGYAYLFMTRQPDEPFSPDAGITAVMQDILARPVLRSPESVDLTDAVREAMGVAEIADEPAAGDMNPEAPQMEGDEDAGG